MGAALARPSPRPRGCLFLCISWGWDPQEAFLLLHHPDTHTCHQPRPWAVLSPELSSWNLRGQT